MALGFNVDAFYNTKEGLAKVSISGNYEDLRGIPDLTIYCTIEQAQNMISAALSSVLSYKGTVATKTELPSANNSAGDVYYVSGTAYAWDGDSWDELSGIVDLSQYLRISDLVAVSDSEIEELFTENNTSPIEPSDGEGNESGEEGDTSGDQGG